MKHTFALEPTEFQLAASAQELERCNHMTERYSLVLSDKQMSALVKQRFEALKNTGRVGFGEGILKKLIYVDYRCRNTAICASSGRRSVPEAAISAVFG